MPQVARVTDLTLGVCDHGISNCCPHTCVGVHVGGSPNVTANNQGVVRIGDISVHTCLHPRSELFLDGEIQRIDSVKVGQKVFTSTGEIGTVTDVITKPYTGKIKKIAYRGCTNYFEVTPEHKVLIKVENRPGVTDIRFDWRDAGQIKAKTLIAIPRLKFGNNRSFYDKAYIYGMWLTCGKLDSDEQELKFQFVKGMNRQVLKCRDKINSVYSVMPTIQFDKENERTYVCIRNKTVIDEITFYGKNRKKTIDLFWYSCDQKTIENLIDGAIAGSFIEGPKANLFTVPNENLANQISFIMMSLGYQQEVYKIRNFTGKNIHNGQSCYKLEWPKEHDPKLNIIYESFITVPIRHIKEEKKYIGDVYDITVSDNKNSHSFCCPAILSNCPHCGINVAVTGSPDVFANGIPVHRNGDVVNEICGTGQTITGSPDVFANG